MTRRIATSLLVVAMVTALVAVGTYALFTDSAASQGNSFTGGAAFLDLKVDGADTLVPLYFAPMGPGDDGYWFHSQFQMMTNAGSVPGGRLSFSVDNVQDFPGETPPPEAAVEPVDVGDVSGIVKIAVRLWPAGSDPIMDPPSTSTLVGEYTMAELQSGITVTNTFEDGSWIEFDGVMPLAADNRIMGDSMTFDGHLTLEQTTP